MMPYETIDFYLSSAFLIALTVLIVVVVLLEIVAGIYYTVKTIYLDYKKNFKNKNNGR